MLALKERGFYGFEVISSSLASSRADSDTFKWICVSEDGEKAYQLVGIKKEWVLGHIPWPLIRLIVVLSRWICGNEDG